MSVSVRNATASSKELKVPVFFFGVRGQRHYLPYLTYLLTRQRDAVRRRLLTTTTTVPLGVAGAVPYLDACVGAGRAQRHRVIQEKRVSEVPPRAGLTSRDLARTAAAPVPVGHPQQRLRAAAGRRAHSSQ